MGPRSYVNVALPPAAKERQELGFMAATALPKAVAKRGMAEKASSIGMINLKIIIPYLANIVFIVITLFPVVRRTM